MQLSNENLATEILDFIGLNSSGETLAYSTVPTAKLRKWAAILRESQPAATVTLPTPQFKGCGTTVSASDAINAFCRLQALVSKHFGSCEPNDCFCKDSHQGMGQGTFESGYRNSLASFKFIQQATINALEANKAPVALPPKPEGEVGG